MTYKDWCLNNIGYSTKTTFFEDFSIAEKFGVEAIKDTYERAFANWKSNVEYLTELVLVLNHKIWFLFEEDEKLAGLYNDLWRKADAYCMENLKGADLDYFLHTTD